MGVTDRCPAAVADVGRLAAFTDTAESGDTHDRISRPPALEGAGRGLLSVRGGT